MELSTFLLRLFIKAAIIAICIPVILILKSNLKTMLNSRG